MYFLRLKFSSQSVRFPGVLKLSSSIPLKGQSKGIFIFQSDWTGTFQIRLGLLDGQSLTQISISTPLFEYFSQFSSIFFVFSKIDEDSRDLTCIINK